VRSLLLHRFRLNPLFDVAHSNAQLGSQWQLIGQRRLKATGTKFTPFFVGYKGGIIYWLAIHSLMHFAVACGECHVHIALCGTELAGVLHHGVDHGLELTHSSQPNLGFRLLLVLDTTQAISRTAALLQGC
jgi:hypothetical protein